MNRSSCLSLLFVGLSLTTASAAIAAPATEGQAQKRVALNAQLGTDSSSSTGSPTADPAAQNTTTPAVSVGTTTPPVADVPAESAAEPTAKPKPRPFAGSSLFISNGMTTNTLFRGQTQYDNPTVESALYISPRYAINKEWQLRARTALSYEWTNSDTTTTNHEPVLGDTLLQLFYRGLPALPGDIQASVALSVNTPTSKESRARTLLFSPGVTVQLVKGFEHVLGGDLTIMPVFGYSHPLYRSRNPEVVDDRPRGSMTCLGGTDCQDLLSGKMNISDTLSYSVYIGQEWGKWNPGIFYRGSSSWAYRPKDVRNPVDGKMITGADDATNVRQAHYFNLFLDYNFNSWFTGEIGFTNEVAGIGEGGQRSNIFFDRYQDTRVYFGGSVQLDNLVKAIQGGNEGEAGIVRARNKHTPMWTF